LAELERLRSLEVCLLAPALEPGFRRAFFVSGGRVCAVRTVPPGAGAALELQAGLAAVRAAPVSFDPEAADELLVVSQFLRRPPPEIEVRPLARLAS
ncbi:MAG TPA: hypothetical protein VIU44_11400, partial [Gaiellaceae bacterium]